MYTCISLFFSFFNSFLKTRRHFIHCLWRSHFENKTSQLIRYVKIVSHLNEMPCKSCFLEKKKVSADNRLSPDKNSCWQPAIFFSIIGAKLILNYLLYTTGCQQMQPQKNSPNFKLCLPIFKFGRSRVIKVGLEL